MAIPEFNEYGLLPPGTFDASTNDVEIRYCGNPNRAQIWQGFKCFMALFEYDFKPLDTCRPDIILDGGFTSNKPHTKDIDIVFDYSRHSLNNNENVLEFMRFYRWAETYHDYADLMYKVDFYPSHNSLGNNFCSFFAYINAKDRNDKKIPLDLPHKGLLRYTP